MFDLPPNVPKSHDHWVGCTLPNRIRVQSIEQVITMMANFRTSKSLLFNPSDPMGPLPHQPGTERQPLSRQAEALQIFQAIPEDDRTPVRHGSQYRSLTEEEHQEEAWLNLDGQSVFQPIPSHHQESPLSDSSGGRNHQPPDVHRSNGPTSPPLMGRQRQGSPFPPGGQATPLYTLASSTPKY